METISSSIYWLQVTFPLLDKPALNAKHALISLGFAYVSSTLDIISFSQSPLLCMFNCILVSTQEPFDSSCQENKILKKQKTQNQHNTLPK